MARDGGWGTRESSNTHGWEYDDDGGWVGCEHEKGIIAGMNSSRGSTSKKEGRKASAAGGCAIAYNRSH
jgi:hypothetical protein